MEKTETQNDPRKFSNPSKSHVLFELTTKSIIRRHQTNNQTTKSHTCDSSCEYEKIKEYYCCIKSLNLHICDKLYCDSLIQSQQGLSCTKTLMCYNSDFSIDSVTFEHDLRRLDATTTPKQGKIRKIRKKTGMNREIKSTEARTLIKKIFKEHANEEIISNCIETWTRITQTSFYKENQFKYRFSYHIFCTLEAMKTGFVHNDIILIEKNDIVEKYLPSPTYKLLKYGAKISWFTNANKIFKRCIIEADNKNNTR